MYLSAERVALVNHTIRTTFEQTCVAWQAIPHWDTGDPGQTNVSDNNSGVVKVESPFEPLTPSVAELMAPTPDALLDKVNAAVAKLAVKVDEYVFPILRQKAAAVEDVPNPGLPGPDIVNAFIAARIALETAGFRAPATLFGDVKAMQALYQLYGGYNPVKNPLLDAGNISDFHHITKVFDNVLLPPKVPAAAGRTEHAIMLGRRQRIAPGAASQASAGEEPVDLAVSIPPSFEIVGETGANLITLNVRIRCAVRPKTPGGLVVITGA